MLLLKVENKNKKTNEKGILHFILGNIFLAAWKKDTLLEHVLFIIARPSLDFPWGIPWIVIFARHPTSRTLYKFLNHILHAIFKT